MPHAPIQIGRDRVVVGEDRLVVDAAVDMPDWEVRNYRRMRHIFQGQSYFLSRRMPKPGGRVVYILEHWPDDDDDQAGGTIVYDEDYVRARDRGRRRYVAAELTIPFLIWFYPLLGLLPGRLKYYLRERVGLHPENSSFASILFEFVAGVSAIGMNPALARIPELSPHRGKIALAGLVLVVDSIARYHKRLAEDPYPYGFYEWLLGRRKL